MIAKLNEGVARLELSLSPQQMEQLESYIGCILECNKTYNLMKADSPDELAVNHILDSLAGLPTLLSLVSEYEMQTDGTVTIGDIGSGGGCPGIPLAIACPQFSFVLVERMEKRAKFLEQTVSTLGLANTTVLCVQASAVPVHSFDFAVFRAFHPFEKKILNWLFKMLKPEGFIIAYKARAEKIAAEMEAVRQIVPDYKKIPLTVPFLEDHERHLVVIHR